MNSTRLRRIAKAIDRLPSKCEVPPEIQAKLEEVHYKVNHNIPMKRLSEEEAAELVASVRAGLGL